MKEPFLEKEERESKLKNAIHEKQRAYCEITGDLSTHFGVGMTNAMNDPDIIKHGNPEVFEKAGWMKNDCKNPIERILMLCEANGKPVDGFMFRESILELRKILNLKTDTKNEK